LAAEAGIVIEDSSKLGEDITTEQAIVMIVLAGMVAFTTWLFFVWAIRDKQFDEVEDISKRVLELFAEPNHAESVSS
ncbi:MAG: cbb3-type cytochrome oxidase assembly protein CcoS, partial [Planctomycetes bacterium]|nr:cbb3-type cytochrome oxidase assembly protein CcoS [Planctomycetota bacterium]